MKRYALLVLGCYALLLLLPLPALGILGSTGIPAPSPASSAPVSPGTSDLQSEEAVFKVLDQESGTVYTYSERDFVLYTVASEMPATYQSEALKAQAVASYTYYSYRREQNASNPDPALQGADFSGNLPQTFPETYTPEGLKERWGNKYDAYYEKLAAAVDEVIGKRLLYEDKLIFAAYHALNSGTTETAETVWGKAYPYLQSVPSPGDKLSPDYQSEARFSSEEFSSKLASVVEGLKLEGDAASWVTGEPVRSSAGTVTALTVGGQTLTGRQIREALGLRSACFTVSYGEDGFVFSVQGYGHGVGMSQYGADYMARQGFTWNEILTHYYTGVTIG